MKEELTKRQEEILLFIKEYIVTNSYPPSIREICNAVNLSSTSTVYGHLSNLEEKGYIKRDSAKKRAIEVVGEKLEAQKNDTIDIPIVGQVAAGIPILAEENIEDTFPLPAEIVKFDKVFMLRVKGESMINAGILDGDLVIVRKQTTANNGEIVVALLENEATVKRFYLKENSVHLIAENENYAPIITKKIDILGKVIGVFREIK